MSTMLTQTTETAIRALLYLEQLKNENSGASKIVTFSEIGKTIGGSSAYLKKIMGHLVRAGILRSQRGIAGGVALAKPSGQITLLQIVEACQGIVTADYCSDAGKIKVCGFHSAMNELHLAITQVLKKWTLKDLSQHPMNFFPGSMCKMRFQALDSDKSEKNELE